MNKKPSTRPDAERDHVALAEYRASIDNIDASLIYLMAERFKITEKVGEYKKEKGLPAASLDREQEQFDRMKKLAAEAGVDQEFMGKFLRFVIDEVIRRHERIKER
ncbi:MAG: chorismate mutase [Gammaproteobacteria bacterium]|nr:chorismate mutase [Gammaproteobacteria bacterium]